MKLLDLTLDDAAANLAVDEALVEQADRSADYPEVMRIWEPRQTMVVVGRSSPISQEVNLAFCRQHGIEVLRRSSGGSSIVTGPGCQMYAVLLDYRRRPDLRMIDRAHRFVLTNIQAAIRRLGVEVQLMGTSDLTLGDRKVSGNSLRCKRNWMIYHGTVMCGFPIELISQCLNLPQRQPDYRSGRGHTEFLTQLPVDPMSLKQALIDQWRCEAVLPDWPRELTEELVRSKYRRDSWTLRVGWSK